ncbi:hypothetical protein K227x_60110 [Rubripirellula lacrimiformis]|uniref:Secreted protein n=1 Tax=Rubripirellula lacrimiformis TaxID=1930273 RepID=A0A517NKL5_9BACT|nr:hypothetical protein [Rubripirellula lacrimiformis]QDT07583.1 hypothetical protein K227x_60110 [Rubripirellula lacrimiformis]
MKKQVLMPMLIGLFAVSLVACGKPEPVNMMENIDEQALADYDQMIADDAKAMAAAQEKSE